MKHERYFTPWKPEKALDSPLKWRKSRRVYLMSDLFQDGVPDEYIDRVFAVMALAPRHTFQVLTKRADRMRDYFAAFNSTGAIERAWNACVWADGLGTGINVGEALRPIPKGLPNVWLGVSVENQHFADERIPLLLQTPAAVRFISYEPALGPIDVRQWLRANEAVREHGSTGKVVIRQRDGIDWLIYGGESGQGARPNDVAWARSVKEQVDATMGGARLFIKQLGAHVRGDLKGCLLDWREMPDGEWRRLPVIVTPGAEAWVAEARERTIGGKFYSRKGGDMIEWPDDLRVRDFPAVAP